MSRMLEYYVPRVVVTNQKRLTKRIKRILDDAEAAGFDTVALLERERSDAMSTILLHRVFGGERRYVRKLRKRVAIITRILNAMKNE